MVRALTALLALCLAHGPSQAELPSDPLNSPMWSELAERYLGSGEIEFDNRVKVTVPSIVENQAQVPVTADARAIANVIRL